MSSARRPSLLSLRVSTSPRPLSQSSEATRESLSSPSSPRSPPRPSSPRLRSRLSPSASRTPELKSSKPRLELDPLPFRWLSPELALYRRLSRA
ncbi:hypothetical protein L596_025891 [Steinernema carpocapsae]|uniref:Uncharacterized protein n=1 Tax=Steinernema carpocapsae TaxID=34508 RepID=A0A4V5ZYY6_STECR|nr:hypothetical protein L596_025891 [Steinernema carpocapsae]